MIKNTGLLKITSVLLSIVLLCSGLLLNVSAAESKVKFLVSSKTYLSQQDKYVEKDTFNEGEIVYISLSASRIYALGGLSFEIAYNPEVFEFRKNSAVCLIDDEKASVVYNDIGDSKVSVAYYTASYNETTTTVGDLFLLPFVVKKLSNNSTDNFSLKVNDLYDNSPWQNDIAFEETDVCTVKTVATALPAELIDAAAALENIKYPDSKADIDSALQMYASLSNEQKNALKERYPSHYKWLDTAKERYNKLAEKAKKDEILSEVENFKKANKAALKLTVDTVKIEDETKVSAAILAYDNCSSAAKSYLMDEAKLINALLDRVESLKEIKEEINEFLTSSSYASVWDEERVNKNLHYEYEHFSKFFELALMSYGMLSDEAKAELKDEYDYLSKIKVKIDEYLAKDKAAEALNAKVSEFMQTYMYAFTRNENNVSIEDKNAINMVVQAYERLSDAELKDALASKISDLKALLEVIDEMSGEEGDKETAYVDVPGETITQTVEVPGETVTQTVEVPGETEYVTETKTKTEKLIQSIMQKTALSKVILYLFVLLGVSILLLMAAYVLAENHKKYIDEKFYNNGSGGLS